MRLTFTGAKFSSAPETPERVGFDLDGLCTTSSSTNVCSPAAGAPKTSKDDGVGGIDNAFGLGVCPLLGGVGSCSSLTIDLTTDDAAEGLLRVGFSGRSLVFKVTDVRIDSPTSGVVGGVMPIASVKAAFREAFFASSGMCTSPIDAAFDPYQDILADGTNKAGIPCNAISFGFSFASSTAFTGSLAPSMKCP